MHAIHGSAPRRNVLIHHVEQGQVEPDFRFLQRIGTKIAGRAFAPTAPRPVRGRLANPRRGVESKIKLAAEPINIAVIDINLPPVQRGHSSSLHASPSHSGVSARQLTRCSRPGFPARNFLRVDKDPYRSANHPLTSTQRTHRLPLADAAPATQICE